MAYCSRFSRRGAAAALGASAVASYFASNSSSSTEAPLSFPFQTIFAESAPTFSVPPCHSSSPLKFDPSKLIHPASLTPTVAPAVPCHDEKPCCSSVPSTKKSSEPAKDFSPFEVSLDDYSMPLNRPVSLDLSQQIPDLPSDLHLRGLVFITRHGARTPMGYMPKQTPEQFSEFWGNCTVMKNDIELPPGVPNPHASQSDANNPRVVSSFHQVPCSRGLLTPLGEFQLKSEGSLLYSYYGDKLGFFPTTFDPTFFTLRSTDLSRTRLTLFKLMQGAFPGATPTIHVQRNPHSVDESYENVASSKENPQIGDLPKFVPAPNNPSHSPIQFFSDPFSPHYTVLSAAAETMYPNHYFCPRLNEIFVTGAQIKSDSSPLTPAALYHKSFSESESALKLRRKFVEAYMARYRTNPAEPTDLAKEMEMIGRWVLLTDDIKARLAHNKPLPKGVSGTMASEAMRLAELAFNHILSGGTNIVVDADGKPIGPAPIPVPSCAYSSEAMYAPRSPLEEENSKLAMGRFLNEIFENMDSIKSFEESTKTGEKKTSPHRAMFYSGHDTTLTPLLSSLHASHALLTTKKPQPSSSSLDNEIKSTNPFTDLNMNHSRFEETRNADGEVYPEATPSSNIGAPGWTPFAANVSLELLERIDYVYGDVSQKAACPAPTPIDAALEQSLRPSLESGVEPLSKLLSPIPDVALEEMPNTAASVSESSKPGETKKAISPYNMGEKDDHNQPLIRRTPLVPSSASLAADVSNPVVIGTKSRWFIRLLVDNREISILPYESYDVIREKYTFSHKDPALWKELCKQKSPDPVPHHRW